MRRRWKWTVAIGVSVAVVSGTVAWRGQPDVPPFQFLEGRTPIYDADDPERTCDFYMFRGNFDRVSRAASQELVLRGFTKGDDVGNLSFDRYPHLPGDDPARDGLPGPDFVWIYRDMRVGPKGRHNIWYHYGPGWITVQVWHRGRRAGMLGWLNGLWGR